MDYSKLERLHELLKKGVITEEEYNEQKARILSKDVSEFLPLNLSDNNYCAIMNFIQIIFGAGWVAVLIMWVIARDKSAKVDKQGKILLNWAISCAIYGIGIGIFAFMTFGFAAFLLPALGIASIVFAILGGMKALDGEIWEYPLTIRIIK